MKKQFLIALLAFAALCPAFGQETEKIPSWARETKEQKAERMAWWTHDRFGLFITFTQPNREIYFDIVRQLAEDMDIEIDDSELTQAAERFALKRGGRSPRIARQFVDWLNARIELGLDY